jgi:hypothetical protein
VLERKQFEADGGKLISLSFPHVEVQSFGDIAILYCLWTTETEVQGQCKLWTRQ